MKCLLLAELYNKRYKRLVIAVITVNLSSIQRSTNFSLTTVSLFSIHL